MVDPAPAAMPAATNVAAPPPVTEAADAAPPLRLHIGGVEAKAGWRILNVQPGPDVDYEGDVADLLPTFADDSVAEIYASHIVEHLGYDKALPETLAQFARVLQPGGRCYIAVPDMANLCRVFTHPKADLNTRIHVMRILYGGRTDPYDVHVAGFDQEILGFFLGKAGFKRMERVEDFGLFEDASRVRIGNVPVSLNIVASL